MCEPLTRNVEILTKKGEVLLNGTRDLTARLVGLTLSKEQPNRPSVYNTSCVLPERGRRCDPSRSNRTILLTKMPQHTGESLLQCDLPYWPGIEADAHSLHRRVNEVE